MPRVGGYATRNRIVLEAMRLFHNRGYHEVGLDEVIERCGASKGVFYFHFRSKDDLAAAVLDMNIVTVPSVVKVCFSGRSWAEGVDTWIKSLFGAADNPAVLAAPVFGLALQLSPLSPAFFHRAMWTVKSFERAIYGEFEAHGWERDLASRRSATFSALAMGHLIRYAYNGRERTLAELRHDLVPLVLPQGSRSPGSAASGTRAAGAKKTKKDLDSVDERSIMLSSGGANADSLSGQRRQKLVERMADVFWRRGYYKTSLNDVSSACAVPKGSLNKLFGDKRRMALEVFDHCARSGAAQLDKAFAATSWRAAAGELAEALKLAGLSRYVFGCPLANMGLELLQGDADLARRASGMLGATEERFASALAAYGFAGGETGSLAGTAVALSEGHLARMILYDDLGDAEECREDLVALVSGL